MVWEVVAQPVGINPGPNAEEPRNEGGMVISLAHGGQRHEVSRVAWVRRNGKNPDTPFSDQLSAEVEKARQARDLLNELSQGQGVLQ